MFRFEKTQFVRALPDNGAVKVTRKKEKPLLLSFLIPFFYISFIYCFFCFRILSSMRRWPRFSCRLPTPAAWSFASAPPKRRSSLHAHAPASLWLCLALALVWCQWLPSAKNNARSLPLFCFFHTLIPLIVSTCHICFFSGAAINSVPLMCYCEIFLQKSPFQLRKEKKQKKINNNNSLALMCLPERLFLLYSVKKIKWNLNKNSFYFFLTFIHKNTNINHPGDINIETSPSLSHFLWI